METLNKVYLFGSRAKGDFKKESDIDLKNIGNEKLIDNIKKEGILIYEID